MHVLYTPMIGNYAKEIKINMSQETGYMCDTIARCMSMDMPTA